MNLMRYITPIFILSSMITATTSFGSSVVASHSGEQFRNYWYPNGAEISRFSLKQARYGEVHVGDAVLIFVTESMNPKIQVN